MLLTWVLPIVGLDIGAISSGNSIVLRFRLDEYRPALVLIIYLYKKPSSGSGGRISNSQPSAIPARWLPYFIDI